MKYRIRFAKYGVMRYVGHLDLMRFFQKALKRANVPLAYSKGFHPHPLISFAAPLSVGVTSGGEYMDIVTEEAVDREAMRDALNKNMVEGVSIVGVTELAETAKNAMAAVEAADYYVYFKTDCAQDERDLTGYAQAIRSFYSDALEIRVTKQTKKSERTIDLKPLIYDFRLLAADKWTADKDGFEEAAAVWQAVLSEEAYSNDMPVFYLKVKSGSTDNIKPELVMEHYLASMVIGPGTYRLGIHRIDMYQTDADGELVSLGG
ncbi:MAG: DUF2344 domain-containing protein [Lachnospiraceae bacterium]|nr:DUF2344 domain-containing protein [Lachnospiraceae bacterium]